MGVKFWKIKLTLVFFILLNIRCFAQIYPIVAGINDSTILYTDQNPDVDLFADYGEGPYYFDIDIDNNGSNDFNFSVYWTPGSGYVGRYLRILPYGENKIAIDRIEPSAIDSIYHPDTTYFPVAMKFNYGDTIDANCVYTNNLTALNEIQFYAVPFYIFNITDWVGVIDKYIGCQINRNDSLINCWIRVDVPFDSRVIIKDYACVNPNITNNNIISKPFNQINIYPNPAKQFFIIENQKDYFKNIKVEIINYQGKIILQKEIYSNRNSYKINLENIEPGLYFVVIYYSNEIFTKKLIVN
jgi:hypothetical protein